MTLRNEQQNGLLHSFDMLSETAERMCEQHLLRERALHAGAGALDDDRHEALQLGYLRAQAGVQRARAPARLRRSPVTVAESRVRVSAPASATTSLQSREKTHELPSCTGKHHSFKDL